MTQVKKSAAQLITIASHTMSAEISCYGAELQWLATVDGKDLQWNGDSAVWQGRAPILFPVIGLLEGGQYRIDGTVYSMAKHGFARHSTFEVTASTANSAEFRLSASDITRAIYPFEFQLDVDFELSGDTLTLGAVISNHGDTAMPASFGFHPALRWPLPFGQSRADHRILFEADETAPVRRINAEGFLRPDPQPSPIAGSILALRDELFVDDALIFDQLNSRRVTYGAAEGPQLEIAFVDFPTLGVWTKPGAQFICIEPWHGFSDPVGFAGDIREKPGSFEVAPGASRMLSMSISLRENGSS
ncbi:aldose 1-epimerase family protein [Sphingomonas sp. PsM26]|nr:aldose 1-epimerase family protein [Sphingomonas sp. PsM26]